MKADLSRAAPVVGLVHFAAASGCLVIAEGIETEAERATIARLGVTLGQGYLLGRPAAVTNWTESTEAGPARVPDLRLVTPPRSHRIAGQHTSVRRAR